jgi:hypothetical protein
MQTFLKNNNINRKPSSKLDQLQDPSAKSEVKPNKFQIFSMIKNFHEKVRLETETVLEKQYGCYIDKPGN